MASHDFGAPRSIDDVLEIDRATRERVEVDDEGELPLMLPQPPLWLILIAFVCALGPLVFFHELGHYLVARLFGIPAETFSIGFGRELVGWTDKQGTRWKVGWLPLGGYVKFVGDMSPASKPADLDSVPPSIRDRAFQLRPVWQRFLVVLAGPGGQFPSRDRHLRGLLLACVGTPRTNVVGDVMPEYGRCSGRNSGRATGSSRSRASDTPTFDDIASVVMHAAGRDGRRRGRARRRHARSAGRRSGRHDHRCDRPEDAGAACSAFIRRPTIGEPVPVFQAVPMAVDQTAR